MDYSLPDIKYVNGILRENFGNTGGNAGAVITGESNQYNVIHADSVSHQ